MFFSILFLGLLIFLMQFSKSDETKLLSAVLDDNFSLDFSAAIVRSLIYCCLTALQLHFLEYGAVYGSDYVLKITRLNQDYILVPLTKILSPKENFSKIA